MPRPVTRRGAAALAWAATWPAATQASATDELRIGLAAGPTSFDPHYHAHAPSYALHRHVFETLLTREHDGRLIPTLAEDWSPLPTGDGWEFRLDPAARFADGAPVTAADVAASIHRVLTVPASPGRWTPFLADLAHVELVDRLTLRLRTYGPAPLLPNVLPAVLVVPEALARSATTAEFNSGTAAVGSGPYRLRRYIAGTEVVLERSPTWWQRDRLGPEPWSTVTFRVITTSPSRVAALLAGNVDFIEGVPPGDVAALRRRSDIAISRANSLRLVYIALSQGASAPEGLSDHAGRPLARNPLQDVRVRRALSLAIDRAAIVAQVMDGEALPAAQVQPEGFAGFDGDLRPPALDRDGARRLLAEAGWGQGFRIRLSGTNDRLVNDERILQAVAQMWQRVGITTEVEPLPSTVFFPRFNAGALAAGLTSWSGSSGEPNTFFVAVLSGRNATRGRGTANPTGYGNAQVDALVDRALGEVDVGARHAGWREAQRIALSQDAAVIPLHHQVNLWAMRRTLSYDARIDELTYATGVRPTSSR
jgi:peptide/nickel transport system substrate-binding protein